MRTAVCPTRNISATTIVTKTVRGQRRNPLLQLTFFRAGNDNCDEDCDECNESCDQDYEGNSCSSWSSGCNYDCDSECNGLRRGLRRILRRKLRRLVLVQGRRRRVDARGGVRSNASRRRSTALSERACTYPICAGGEDRPFLLSLPLCLIYA